MALLKYTESALKDLKKKKMGSATFLPGHVYFFINQKKKDSSLGLDTNG